VAPWQNLGLATLMYGPMDQVLRSCDHVYVIAWSSSALPICHNFCQILKIGHNFDAFGKKILRPILPKYFWHNLAYFSYFE